MLVCLRITERRPLWWVVILIPGCLPRPSSASVKPLPRPTLDSVCPLRLTPSSNPGTPPPPPTHPPPTPSKGLFESYSVSVPPNKPERVHLGHEGGREGRGRHKGRGFDTGEWWGDGTVELLWDTFKDICPSPYPGHPSTPDTPPPRTLFRPGHPSAPDTLPPQTPFHPRHPSAPDTLPPRTPFHPGHPSAPDTPPSRTPFHPGHPSVPRCCRTVETD